VELFLTVTLKRQKKKEKRRELNYQQKTIEMARVHWDKEKKESLFGPSSM
jgi:hypothetical protein